MSHIFRVGDKPVSPLCDVTNLCVPRRFEGLYNDSENDARPASAFHYKLVFFRFHQ